MRCLIVDDDPTLRQELRQSLQRWGLSTIVEAGDVAEALRLTTEHQPDVVFLDVQLWGETGFDYLDQLEQNSPHIVFVTAYDDFALDGFEREAIDYLLKPVPEKRLQKTLARLQRRINLDAVKSSLPEGCETVVIREGANTHLVLWKEIHAILSEGNYTRVCLANGTEPLVLKPLKDWLKLAPAGALTQVHRTALIHPSLAKTMVSIPGGFRHLVLANGRIVPVGRTYWQTIKPIFE